MQQPERGDDLAQPEPTRRPGVRRDVDRGEIEHEVGDHRADARADDLHDDVDAARHASTVPPRMPVGHRHDRVEVRTRDRAEAPGSAQRGPRRSRWSSRGVASPTSSG